MCHPHVVHTAFLLSIPSAVSVEKKSCGIGVVSLTLGNSLFPFGHSLADNMQLHSQFFLTDPFFFPEMFNILVDHGFMSFPVW